MTKTTNFPVDIPKLKEEALEFVNSGTSHTINNYGNSIEKYLEDNLGQYYSQLIKSNTLFEYIWFYCLKAGLYEQSYKYESNDEFNLHDYQANELAYDLIYSEIKNDALNKRTLF